MKKKHLIMLFLIILIILIWWINTYTIKTTYVTIESDKIENEIKIVQISDLHGAVFGKNNKNLIEKIKKENPNIICVTGDMHTANNEREKQIAFNLLTELAKEYKVYFVNGEHDSSEGFMDMLNQNGVNVLDYKKEEITINNTKLNLYGITNQYYSPTFDLNNEFDINKNEYNILLAHISNFKKFEEFGIDLSLCGDTHGGLIRLPFIGAVINRGIWFPEIGNDMQDMDIKCVKGLYKMNNSYLFVSSGLGSYPIGIRLFNRPEIAVIKLKNRL